jgi:hypothetical protein
MSVECFGQRVAQRRAAYIEIEPRLQKHVADAPRARILLMQDDQDFGPGSA